MEGEVKGANYEQGQLKKRVKKKKIAV